MNNKKISFKTNLNCGGCVSKIQNDFDNAPEITHWNVDTNHTDKLLTVEGEITSDKVIEMVKSKGFTIEKIKENND